MNPFKAQSHIALHICLLLAALAGNIQTAAAAELISEFSGKRSGTTPDFEVGAPWLMDWRVNGEYPQMFGIDVSLVDAETGRHEGWVLKTKYPGNGVRLFNQAGRFRLHVSSTMVDWMFKIKQLTAEEAELYTPK